MVLYNRRLRGVWEAKIEAKPEFALNIADEYHIVIQKSNCCDENAFDEPPIWAVGCIPEIQ
jgi:hypothetical protein